jgi:hypothetical protein
MGPIRSQEARSPHLELEDAPRNAPKRLKQSAPARSWYCLAISIHMRNRRQSFASFLRSLFSPPPLSPYPLLSSPSPPLADKPVQCCNRACMCVIVAAEQKGVFVCRRTFRRPSLGVPTFVMEMPVVQKYRRPEPMPQLAQPCQICTYPSTDTPYHTSSRKYSLRVLRIIGFSSLAGSRSKRSTRSESPDTLRFPCLNPASSGQSAGPCQLSLPCSVVACIITLAGQCHSIN